MNDDMVGVPIRFHSRCELCQGVLNTQLPGNHQRTTGWVKNRSGGGGHGVSLPERENRWAHGYCVDRATRGLTNQSSLL